MHIWTRIFSQLCKLFLFLPVLHFSDAIDRRSHARPAGTLKSHTVEQVRRSCSVVFEHVPKKAAFVSCDLVGIAFASTIRI